MINDLDGWESVSKLALALSLEGRRFAREGNFHDAEKQLRRALAVDVYCMAAYVWLEYVLDEQERFDEACFIRILERRAKVEMAIELENR